MKQKLALLLALLDSEWLAVEGLFEKLEVQGKKSASSEADTVFTAYLLHNLYGAVEEILKQVANTFENHVDDPGQFHAELLRRMSLDIPGFRPAVLSQECSRSLQELRKFRHVFRHAYDYELDADRINELAAEMSALRASLTADKDRFRQFLVRSVET